MLVIPNFYNVAYPNSIRYLFKNLFRIVRTCINLRCVF